MEELRSLLSFIDGSVSPFHAAQNAAELLTQAGFTRLSESDEWSLTPGNGYFVQRGGSSVLAFRAPEKELRGFLISAAHCDSPALVLKENFEVEKGALLCADVERYGGAVLYSWYNRPLGVAGRVMVRQGETVRAVNVDLDEPVAVIPGFAPHLDRENGQKPGTNVQTDLQPLLGGKAGGLMGKIAEKLGVAPEQIVSSDLSFYPLVRGCAAGVDGELICSPRLDDLMCAYTTLLGFLAASPAKGICPVWCLFNNEEIGSGTPQGADSAYLTELLSRLGGTDLPRRLAGSFFVSADNAQGTHPNQLSKYDAQNACTLNGGVVIKHNANRSYATDAYSDAVFKLVCQRAGVPVQSYANRSDIPGGGTLGRLSVTHVSVPTVDIGLAQLAMHSCVETAGAKDAAYMIRAMKSYYECDYRVTEDGFTL